MGDLRSELEFHPHWAVLQSFAWLCVWIVKSEFGGFLWFWNSQVQMLGSGKEERIPFRRMEVSRIHSFRRLIDTHPAYCCWIKTQFFTKLEQNALSSFVWIQRHFPTDWEVKNQKRYMQSYWDYPTNFREDEFLAQCKWSLFSSLLLSCNWFKE